MSTIAVLLLAGVPPSTATTRNWKMQFSALQIGALCTLNLQSIWNITDSFSTSRAEIILTHVRVNTFFFHLKLSYSSSDFGLTQHR